MKINVLTNDEIQDLKVLNSSSFYSDFKFFTKMQLCLLLWFNMNVVLSESLDVDLKENSQFKVFSMECALRTLHNHDTKANMLLFSGGDHNVSCDNSSNSCCSFNTDIGTRNNVGYSAYSLAQIINENNFGEIRHIEDNHYPVLQLHNLSIGSCYNVIIFDNEYTICKDGDSLQNGSLEDVITHFNGNIEIIFDNCIFYNITTYTDYVLHTNEKSLLNFIVICQTNKDRMTKDTFVKTSLLVVSDLSFSKVMGDIHDCIDVTEIIIIDANDGETSYSNVSWMEALYSSNYDNSNQIANEHLNPRIDIMNRVDDKIKSVTRLYKRNTNIYIFYELQSDDIEILQPIFTIWWLASIATCNVVFENPNRVQSIDQFHTSLYYRYSLSSKLIGLCINGYRYGIKLASTLSMDIDANLYVNRSSKIYNFSYQ